MQMVHKPCRQFSKFIEKADSHRKHLSPEYLAKCELYKQQTGRIRHHDERETFSRIATSEVGFMVCSYIKYPEPCMSNNFALHQKHGGYVIPMH